MNPFALACQDLQPDIQDERGQDVAASGTGTALIGQNQGMLKGKYHCTVDLLFDWLGISCMTTDNFCFYLHYLQNRHFKPLKQEVNSTMILPPLVFPDRMY